MDILTDSSDYINTVNEVKDIQNLTWAERYRPTKLNDVILPQSIKDSIQYAIKNNNFQNMIFHSWCPGTGKTTVAKLIPEEYGCDYYFIKTAAEGRLTTVENDIPLYGMQKTANNKPRFIILDEADRVRGNVEAFYTALQPIIENTRSTLRFILTVNHLYRIPEPIRSRCKPISFSHNDESIKKPMWKRIKEIAKEEVSKSKGTIDEETLKQIAKVYFPDMRAIICAMQNNFNENKGSIKGKIDVVDNNIVKTLWDIIYKEGDIVKTRKYFTEQVSDINNFYPSFLEHVFGNCEQKKLLQIGSIIAEHQFRSAYDSVDPEINSFGMFCEIIHAIHG
jgi:DNA polymerase III delta prime subunit